MAMKNNPLNDIVKCDIDVSSPGSSGASFDAILLVVPGPGESGEKTMERTTAVSAADELLDYGFKTEDPAYLAAMVAFSQSPSPDTLYVCVRKTAGEEDGAGGLLEEADQSAGEDGTEIPGGSGAEDSKEETQEPGNEEETGASGYEDLAITLSRAGREAEFYGIHITAFKDPSDVKAAVAWAEANEKLFGFEYSDLGSCPVSNFSYYWSFCVYSGSADGYTLDQQPAENQYAALAWMAKCFGYDPGTETWHLKELAAIVPSALGTDQKKELGEGHINTFLRYAGCNCTIGGMTLSGEWIDVIRFRDWLKADMQTRVFQVLKSNRKVPFTDSGIGLVEGAMERSLKEGQDIGGIAPTEYDSDDNAIPGYQVSVPRVSDLTEAQRKSRKLPNCNYSARLAGAIHVVEIKGYLTF